MERKTFRLIIAGTRTFSDYNLLQTTVDFLLRRKGEVEIVSGGARGADRLGELYARRHNIPLKVFPADWSTGRSAGIKRNAEMAAYADALVAFWDGESRGTRNMIEEANKRNLQIRIVRYDGEQTRLL